jgi:gliding motility-associated-like protein
VSPGVVTIIKDPVVDEPKLIITAESNTSICEGANVVLSSSVAPSYQWYKFGIAIAGANSKTFTATTSGMYTVSRLYTNGCNGLQSDGVEVKVNVSPSAPSLDIVQPTCNLGTGTITVSSPKNPGNTYSIDGLDYSNVNGFFTQVVAGTYNVTVKNASGCVGGITVAVVNQNPLTPQTPTVEITNPLCPEKTGVIKITSPVGNGFTYSIDGSTYLNNTGVFTSVAPGAYSVSVKNASGCVSPGVVTIIKDPVVDEPKLVITAESNTSICEGATVVLTSSISPTYQWYKYGVAIAGANGRTFTASTEGVYTVSKISTSGCAAVQSGGIEVNVVARPVPPLISADKMFFCDGDSAVLNSTFSTGIQWFRDGIAITGAISARYVAKQGGTYAALAINNNGCRSPFSEALSIKMVDLPVTPILTIKGTSQFCADESRLLQVNVPNGLTVNWYKNGTLINAYSKDTLRVNTAAEYTVKFLNSSGCLSLVSNKIVTEIGCNTTGIYIADVFTPNGDGINDIIKPVCVGIAKFKFFKIYNRWGNILFESTDEGKGWDGRFRSQVQPADSYIWLVEGLDTNGKEIRKSGVLNLIK